MPGDDGQSALTCPAAIAIHDHSNVSWNFAGLISRQHFEHVGTLNTVLQTLRAHGTKHLQIECMEHRYRLCNQFLSGLLAQLDANNQLFAAPYPVAQ
jgi:hypothetical protein